MAVTEEKILCDQCGSEMKYVTKSIVQSGRTKKKFRKRRFKCINIACNHIIAVYADGERDLEIEPYLAAEEGRKLADDLNQN